MKVLILDIGNSKTKCYVFEIDTNRKYYQTVDCIHEASCPTPRKHPHDLLDTCRRMMFNAICEYSPDAGIVTSYGDAFVLKHERRFVQADDPAPNAVKIDYHLNGWPENIQLTGLHNLKKKHASRWRDMYSINGWVTSQLCGKASDDPWHAWDITQASVSGCYNLQSQKWMIEDAGEKPSASQRFPCQYAGAPNIIPSSKKVGNFEGMPILAGGMDNAFLDTLNPDPYIIAGTWLVMGCIAKTDKHGKPLKSEWSNARKQGGVRWLISGNGNYHKQIVKKVSNPITEAEMAQALKDLTLLGVEGKRKRSHYKQGKGWFEPARVRILGGYGETLYEDLDQLTNTFSFYTPSHTPHRADLYQHECSAMFVYNAILSKKLP